MVRSVQFREIPLKPYEAPAETRQALKTFRRIPITHESLEFAIKRIIEFKSESKGIDPPASEELGHG
jgi:hypothetical protein